MEGRLTILDEPATEKLFGHRLKQVMAQNESLVCVGLDPDLDKLPEQFAGMGVKDAIVAFNRAIVEATRDLVCAYKPNLGFYAAYGVEGLAALAETRWLIPAEIPVILDCKVGDMDNTAARYAKGYFEEWGFDAVTANPYLGEDSLVPFLTYWDRGVIVLCKTSNRGSGDLQDVVVRDTDRDRALFLTMAERAQRWNAEYAATVGLVVGATYPEQLAEVRGICPDLPVLLPGVGAQAGDLEAAVDAGLDSAGLGLMVSSSRAIIYAGSGEDFAERSRAATLSLRDTVNAVRTSRLATVGG